MVCEDQLMRIQSRVIHLRAIRLGLLLAAATLTRCKGETTTVLTPPTPTPSPSQSSREGPLPFEGVRELSIGVSGACASRFPRYLRERTYPVDVQSSTGRSFLRFTDRQVLNPANPDPAVSAWVDATAAEVHFSFTMQEVLATRALGNGLTEHETLDVFGNAVAPLTPDLLDGHLSGTIRWRHNQVDPPAAQCTSETHSVLLRPAQ
jgi:hypothetical protein